MVRSVNINELHASLLSAFPHMTEQAILARAQRLLEMPDMFNDPLRRWVDGAPLVDLKIGEFSIRKIMALRSCDSLSAIEDLALYMRDPVRGKLHILRRRGNRLGLE